MDENAEACDDRFTHPIALAMQGMAVWYLLTGVTALVFVTLVLLLGEPGSAGPEVYGVSAIAGAEVTGGGLAGAIVLGGISWALLGMAFLHPRWSVILVPGLIGAATSQLFDLIGWPVSVLIGGFVAYWMIRNRLETSQSADLPQ
jgi:hypothetical protein